MPDYSTATLRAPLQSWHQEHGAKLLPYGRGFAVTTYSGVGQEVPAARERLGLADMSAMVRTALHGADVSFLSWKLAGYTPAVHPQGAGPFANNGLICRLTDDHLLLLASTAHGDGIAQYVAKFCQGRRAVATD